MRAGLLGQARVQGNWLGLCRKGKEARSVAACWTHAYVLMSGSRVGRVCKRWALGAPCRCCYRRKCGSCACPCMVQFTLRC